ncbi:MAG: NAD-binding protein [Propionibacteriaceae bacterium]|jgi:Trk K+ transport system NAD-binding subunit|nr:NAD-binding protein [Propionibacteriaceae bacterium]
MVKKAGLKERLSYWFDNVMGRGTASLVLLLACVTVGVVIVVTFLAAFVDQQHTLPQLLWIIFRGVLSPGMPTGNEGAILYVILLIVVTLCGIFITSFLISILNTGLTARIRTLRKGRSRVIATGHTVVLGYNEASYTVLSELVAANANHKKQVVVIIDAYPKDKMEDEIRKRIPDSKTTRIICRTGNIDTTDDLRICAIENAKSVIVSAGNDFQTIKAVMAASALLKEHAGATAFLTAVIKESHYVKAAEAAGGSATEVISFDHDVAQIIAHCCRYSGLSAVFTELFNNGGCEFYVENIPELVGCAFLEAGSRLPSSTLVGLVRDGRTWLNPPLDAIIAAEDHLIVIAEDDGLTAVAATMPQIDQSQVVAAGKEEAPRMKLLVLGFNHLLGSVLRQEDAHLATGSTVTIADERHDIDLQALQADLRNLQLSTRVCDVVNHGALEDLLSGGVDNVLILTDLTKSDEEADAKVLMLLLMLRSIAVDKGYHFTITSEMRNVRNQELVKVDNACDFVVSSHLASLIAVQVSQSRHLAEVFKELLDARGAQLQVRPAKHYLRTDVEVDMATVAAATGQRGEVFVGHQVGGLEPGTRPRITISPPQESRRKFGPDDLLVVLTSR